MNFEEFCGTRGRSALLGYLGLWAAATAYLLAKGADWTFPVVSLLLFGVGLSALAWFLTRRSEAPPVAVNNPRRQSLWFIAYLAFYAFVLIGWGLGAIKEAIAVGESRQFAVLGYKLLIHVAAPVALIGWLGGSLRDTFDPGLRRRGVPLLLLVFAALMFALIGLLSPWLSELGATGVSGAPVLPWVMLSWLWMSIEAGLCEEYLFRAGLQSRLTAWFGSPLAAIVATSALFALAHWPGLYLRGGPGVDGWSTDPLQVAAFTIAALSPLAIMLGVLWARTRSLLLVVLVHGAIDALPHAAEMVKAFGQAF